jgi:hypothetical protein
MFHDVGGICARQSTALHTDALLPNAAKGKFRDGGIEK